MGRAHRAQIVVQIPTTAAGTDYNARSKCLLPGDWYIEEAEFIPNESVSADAANVTDLALSIGGTEVHSHDTTTGQDGALTGGTAIDFTSSLSGATRILSYGDALLASKTDGGTGQIAGGHYVLHVREMA